MSDGDRDAEIMETARRISALVDKWTEGLLVCRSCRNWNHWHIPDGPCLDARCECPRRPSGKPALHPVRYS